MRKTLLSGGLLLINFYFKKCIAIRDKKNFLIILLQAEFLVRGPPTAGRVYELKTKYIHNGVGPSYVPAVLATLNCTGGIYGERDIISSLILNVCICIYIIFLSPLTIFRFSC